MDRIQPARSIIAVATIRRWAGNLAAIGLLLLAAWCSRGMAQTPADAVDTPYRSSDIVNPLDPLAGVAAGSDTRWHATLALVADPVDTRLGRTFDIQVSTLIRSFQFDGYVLQGHAMPWQIPDKGEKPSRLHESLPGVLLFRNDRWRQNAQAMPAVEYFVVYLVGESPVFGIQRVAFCRAARRVRGLLAGQQRPDADDAKACEDTAKQSQSPSGASAATGVGNSTRPVSVLGPMFSGTMTSLAEVAVHADLHLLMLSPSATVDSNTLLAQSPAARARLSYHSVTTWQQKQQLQTLFDYLFKRDRICPNQVTILAEQSSFGQGAQYVELQPFQDRDERCSGKLTPMLMQFPQNIAAIRAEHAQQQARKRGDDKLSLVPNRNLELDMQTAGESLDLPPVYQASMTTRSDELSLQQVMDQLSVRIQPKAVLVVASDVRDRLYMLDVVRQAVPSALPVVLEGDHLLAHPDYRRDNRGTLMLPHTRLQLCYARSDRQQVWKECSWRSRQARERRRADAAADAGKREVRRFSFATDYAAGLFRASYLLLHPEAGGGHDDTRRIAVVTLAGIQSINFPSATDKDDSSGSNGVLIATEWRTLSANFLVPIMCSLSALLLASSLWMWRSSRPGRTILPPLRHALREAEWWLQKAAAALRREPWPSRRHAPVPRHDRTATPLLGAMVVLSLLLSAMLTLEWVRMLQAAAGGGIGLEGNYNSLAFRAYMRLVHGRDLSMALILAGLYGWLVLLAVARINAWNRRCRHHWRSGERHPGRNPHANRSFHGPSMTLAALLSVPPLLAWWVRCPLTVDDTVTTTLMAFVILLACLYFLIQSFLQANRLCSLTKDIYTWVLDALPKGVIGSDWPSPQLLHQPPRSPLTVVFGDRDWFALAAGGDDWPAAPQAYAVDEGTLHYRSAELESWQNRTVAELKFGLVCVRTCLWAAFIGPIVVLAMIHVHPFAFEWEHSVLALGMMLVAFVTSAFITYRAEQAPLIGQMFTRDGGRVSYPDVFKAMISKAVLALTMLAATLAPDLSEPLQGLMGMFKF